MVKRYLNRNIWIVNVILVIFVILTAAIVGNYLYDYVYKSDYVIDLYKAKSSNSELKDVDRDYHSIMNLELFKTSYNNNQGKMTVKSSKGDKVLAPGTDGDCVFSVKNTSDKNLNYRMDIRGNLDSQDSLVPIEMCVVRGNHLGDSMEWKNISSLDESFSMNDLSVGDDVAYTIYWRWPYEKNSDEVDTSLGNLTVNQNLDYTVEVQIVAEESLNQEIGVINRIINSVKTGDDTQIFIWCIVMMIALVLLKAGFRRYEDK